MFIPYRPRIKLTRFPWITVFVSIFVIVIYAAQESNEQEVVDSAVAYCTGEIETAVEFVEKKYMQEDTPCWEVLSHTYMWTLPEKHVKWYVDTIRNAGDEESAQEFLRYYRSFAAQAPGYLTGRLWQEQGNFNPLKMLSSSFAHADWGHAIGNLFFFVSFGLVVEAIVGGIIYTLLILSSALFIGFLGSLLQFGEITGATLGLSGVVTAMMVLAAYLAPRVKINYFYFFFIFVGVLSYPLWALIIWNVGWDLLDFIFFRDTSNINYTAHLSGAIFGLSVGLLLFRDRRKWVKENLIPEERPLTEDEPWLHTLNAIAGIPVVTYFVLIYTLLAITLVTWFLKTYAIQLLIATPFVAVGIWLHQSKHNERPDWDRYQEAMVLFDRMYYQEAFKKMSVLAEKGYSRAQYQLARMFANGHGTYKDEELVAHWFRKAAKRGHAQAQYAVGACYADGRGVNKSINETMRWYQAALTNGIADAGMGLGHYYESHPDKEKRDFTKAAHAYSEAAKIYKENDRPEDAEMAEKCSEACFKQPPGAGERKNKPT